MKESKRFKQFGPYIFDKVIFRISLFLIIIGLAIVFLNFGFKDYIYLECDNPAGCKNQYFNYYGDCIIPIKERYENPAYTEICKYPVLNDGQVLGEKPPKILNYVAFMLWGIFILAILLNHLAYNRGIKWKKQELKRIQKDLEKHFKISKKK
jgi:hypothetical protein